MSGSRNLPVDKEQPGQQVATLTLSTGEVVQLDDWTSTQRLKEVSMDVSGGEIKVRAEEKETQPQSREPVYNTLTVPRGENYSIVLADGTPGMGKCVVKFEVSDLIQRCR